MTPEVLAASLRRVCEMADLAMQGLPVVTTAEDERHLSRIEHMTGMLYRKTEPEPTARSRRLIVLDTPEEVAGVEQLVDAAARTTFKCTACLDTLRVQRKNRHGILTQTTEACPVCTAEPAPWEEEDVKLDIAGVTSAETALRLARAMTDTWGWPQTAVAPEAEPEAEPETEMFLDPNGNVQRRARRLRNTNEIALTAFTVRGVSLRPGMVLTTDQRNYLRGMAQNGAAPARMICREILDREPSTPAPTPVREEFNFGHVARQLGARIDLREYMALKVIMAEPMNYTQEQYDKAQRFLSALPRRNAIRMEQEFNEHRARNGIV